MFFFSWNVLFNCRHELFFLVKQVPKMPLLILFIIFSKAVGSNQQQTHDNHSIFINFHSKVVLLDILYTTKHYTLVRGCGNCCLMLTRLCWENRANYMLCCLHWLMSKNLIVIVIVIIVWCFFQIKLFIFWLLIIHFSFTIIIKKRFVHCIVILREPTTKEGPFNESALIEQLKTTLWQSTAPNPSLCLLTYFIYK